MVNSQSPNQKSKDRAVRTVRAILPRGAKVRIPKPSDKDSADLILGDHPIKVEWIGDGNLGDARRLLSKRRGRPDIAVAKRLSPGAREALSKAGIGWVDETGAAEVAVDSIVVSRTGRPPAPAPRPKRWTPAVLAVAEALLCDTKGTVEATSAATGLSVGSCSEALRFLADSGLIDAKAKRGRGAARTVSDPDRLLEAYAGAVVRMAAPISLEIGVSWRDPVAGLVSTGRLWEKEKIRWAATSTVAAAVIAPHLSNISGAEVYVDADSIVGLEAVASAANLRPIEGGRLTLRPFPTVSVRVFVTEVDGLQVAPWPRVFVDLRQSGVRGEEAAEHLREVIRGR